MRWHKQQGPIPREVTTPVAVAPSAPERARQGLQFGFVLLPLIAGFDKFTHLLTDWNAYLSPVFANLEEATLAAADGRVGELFAADGIERWGRFDPRTRRVDTRPEPLVGDVDLVDEAALQTLLHDGVVYTLPPEKVPGRGAVAALFRY